jgi:hypothetical protein
MRLDFSGRVRALLGAREKSVSMTQDA